MALIAQRIRQTPGRLRNFGQLENSATRRVWSRSAPAATKGSTSSTMPYSSIQALVARFESLVQHVHPDVGVGLKRVGKAEQKAHWNRDATGFPRIRCVLRRRRIAAPRWHHDDHEQSDPQPGGRRDRSESAADQCAATARYGEAASRNLSAGRRAISSAHSRPGRPSGMPRISRKSASLAASSSSTRLVIRSQFPQHVHRQRFGDDTHWRGNRR